MGKKLTTEEFIAKAIAIHGDKYDYSTSTYIKTHTHINITCYIPGEFQHSPNNHIRGQGCPICKNSKGELKILLQFYSFCFT